MAKNKKELQDLFAKFLDSVNDETEEEDKDEKEIDTIVEKLGDKISSAVADAMKANKADDGAQPNKAVDAGKGTKDLNVEDMTKEERIAEFFKSLVQGDKARTKALAEGSPENGGYLVPEEFRADIVAWAQDRPTVRSRATVFNMNSDTMNIPRLAGDVAVYWGTENTQIATTSADFGEIELTPYKLNALIYLSMELFEDSNPDIVSFLTNRFAQRISREEDRVFVVGSGSGQPKGINQETLPTINAGNAGEVDDLIQTFWLLPQQHRENAVWLISNSTLANLSKRKTTTGDYLVTNPVSGGLPQIMGRPVLEQNDLGKTIVFGDLSFYYIGDRRQMSVRTTTEGAGTFEKDQVCIKVTERVDGKVALTRAFRTIDNF